VGVVMNTIDFKTFRDKSCFRDPGEINEDSPRYSRILGTYDSCYST